MGLLDPEFAHSVAMFALKNGLVPRPREFHDPVLATELWGLKFSNPIGIAAGFDKNGEVAESLKNLGFGFVEVGTVTPKPQSGNPRPRMFRLNEDDAIINRLGFNNRGIDYVLAQIEATRTKSRSGIIGINVGKNRDTDEATTDYEKGIEAFRAVADYLVVNISSPNTPGLRDLQLKENLDELVQIANSARQMPNGDARRPLLIKVAPDLQPGQISDIADIAIGNGVDGIIATNTTIDRPNFLTSIHKNQAGGLSGRPLMPVSTEVLGEFYRLTSGKMPLIGVGGVFSGDDAYQKIRAGASLIQLYSGMIFNGPWIARTVSARLAALLERDGFSSVADAVGADQR